MPGMDHRQVVQEQEVLMYQINGRVINGVFDRKGRKLSKTKWHVDCHLASDKILYW